MANGNIKYKHSRKIPYKLSFKGNVHFNNVEMLGKKKKKKERRRRRRFWIWFWE
jgi:hypothetical protein